MIAFYNKLLYESDGAPKKQNHPQIYWHSQKNFRSISQMMSQNFYIVL
ncbi:unnamed protein product [Paramecium sonneborni]|uniref:Uncharacterized protein n=1 Tax=Paramecium sonneborni TaxID=65129 RepID=A0A8S1RRD4_9CILI|nr:unnamed protein product [Paramecium sonneborni]